MDDLITTVGSALYPRGDAVEKEGAGGNNF